MSKIALDVKESRTISNDYVTQAGKENNVIQKNPEQIIEYSWE